MPRVIGMTESDAVRTLMQNGLTVEYPLEEVNRSDVAAGFIVDQHPYPGNSVKKGRQVKLVLSSGPQRVRIPPLVGRREQDVFSDLRGTTLEVGEIARVHHSGVEANVVLAQDPPPGDRIVLARRVNLLISLGPESPTYIMPNLLGLPEARARALLNQSAFLFNSDAIQYETTLDPDEWNRVLRQRPEAGLPVSTDEPVQIWVGATDSALSSGRMVEVVFEDISVPLGAGTPSLIVWDDLSRVSDIPSVVPVSIELWQDDIIRPMLVYGDALIELGLVRSEIPVLQYESLDQQFYSAD